MRMNRVSLFYAMFSCSSLPNVSLASSAEVASLKIAQILHLPDAQEGVLPGYPAPLVPESGGYGFQYRTSKDEVRTAIYNYQTKTWSDVKSPASSQKTGVKVTKSGLVFMLSDVEQLLEVFEEETFSKGLRHPKYVHELFGRTVGLTTAGEPMIRYKDWLLTAVVDLHAQTKVWAFSSKDPSVKHLVFDSKLETGSKEWQRLAIAGESLFVGKLRVDLSDLENLHSPQGGMFYEFALSRTRENRVVNVGNVAYSLFSAPEGYLKLIGIDSFRPSAPIELGTYSHSAHVGLFDGSKYMIVEDSQSLGRGGLWVHYLDKANPKAKRSFNPGFVSLGGAVALGDSYFTVDTDITGKDQTLIYTHPSLGEEHSKGLQIIQAGVSHIHWMFSIKERWLAYVGTANEKKVLRVFATEQGAENVLKMVAESVIPTDMHFRFHTWQGDDLHLGFGFADAEDDGDDIASERREFQVFQVDLSVLK